MSSFESEDPAEAYWGEIEAELIDAYELLFCTPIETVDQIRKGEFKKTRKEASKTFYTGIISRRLVSSGLDALDSYVEEGRTLYHEVSQLYRDRVLSVEFLLKFGKLKTSHGFVIAHFLDNSESTASFRGGSKPKQPFPKQFKYFCSKVIFYLDTGISLSAAKERAGSDMFDELNSAKASERQWYKNMIGRNGDLKKAFLQVTEAKARAAIQDPDP